MKTPVIHVSNSIDTLIMLMRDHLFLTSSKPFTKKIIFLPQPSLKNTLMTRFVSDKKLDVVLGVEFQELGSGIQSLFRAVSNKTLLFPPLDLLSLHLESLIDEDNPPFAASLASEFLKFGKFSGSPLKGWQKELWEKAFKEWNTPYQLLESPLKKPQTIAEIHLFNFPFLPKLYHLFFARLSVFFPIHYYQFSPCREFWSDMTTEREKQYLIKKDPQITPYLESGHPLLANFGKLGRETFRIFEEEDFLLDEHYVSKESTTALSHIQNDILNFQETETKNDTSIRLFSSPSKLREVEILYHTLLEMNHFPTDIQVFAPQISDYAPLIDHVFGAEESPFDITIRDLPKHPLIENLFHLFALDRFEPTAVFRLLSSPYFSPLTQKEVQEFRSWIEKGGVKWGVDAKHRQHLLPNYLEESESGTWEQAFAHLLDNLIFLPETQSSWDLPYLDFSDAELLGKCITLIRSLRKDLDFLNSAHLPLSEWAEQIHSLFERYFTIPDEDRQTYQSFEQKLQMLRELGQTNKTPYAFASIKRYLSSLLKEKRGARLSKQLNAITFRSLKLGTILSSKVIALLGMNEGAFPRSYIHSSLSLLDSKSDYCPIPSDEDRYLFLEALLSAQETLLLSYQNVNEEDGKEQPPSLLIQELDLQVETHPSFPFHHTYFSKKNPYPKRHFDMAKKFYAPKKPAPFIPEFLNPTTLPTPPKDPIEINVTHLLRFAKHPLRYYCNQTLNLYFPYDDKTDEEFQLSPLKKTQLYKQTFHEADLRGQVPLGRFKEIAQRRLEEETPPEQITIDLTLENFHLTGSMPIPLKPQNLPDHIKTYPQNLLHNNHHKSLLHYLRYYQIAIQTPSPLHPLLADSLLKKDPHDLAKKLKKLPTDPYLQTTFKHANPEVIFDTWAPFLRTTFQEIL